MPTTQTLLKSKDCKHSVRFDAKPDEKEPALTSIYVSKPSGFSVEKSYRDVGGNEKVTATDKADDHRKGC